MKSAMDTSEQTGVESEEPEHEVQYVIRLPCGHMYPEPKGTAHVICDADSCRRKWHVYRKGPEILAREEM